MREKDLEYRKRKLDEYLYCLISHDSNIDIKIRLKLGILIESINNDISIDKLNDTLIKIINIFLELGIKLKSNDFNFSVLSKKYMSCLLSNKDKCIKYYLNNKDLIKDIKLCLKELVIKYKSKLEELLENKIDLKVQSFVASDISLYDDYLRDKKLYIIDSLIDREIDLDKIKCFIDGNVDNKVIIECFCAISYLIEFNRYKFLLDDYKYDNDISLLSVFNYYLESFECLKKIFDKEFNNYDLEVEIDRFINFIYNPYCELINNISIISDYSLESNIINYFKDKGIIFRDVDLEDNLFDTYELFRSVINYY